jgi:hypothetical protein
MHARDPPGRLPAVERRRSLLKPHDAERQPMSDREESVNMAGAGSKGHRFRRTMLVLLGLLALLLPGAGATAAPSVAGQEETTPSEAQLAPAKVKMRWTCVDVRLEVATGRLRTTNLAKCPPDLLKNLKFTMTKLEGAGKASCGLNPGTPSLSGGYLRATSAYFCTGMSPPWWSQWRFERSSWSGYRPYSQWGSTPVQYSNGGSGSGTIQSRCGSGGTYDYHLRGQAINYPGVVVANKAGAARRFTCGTGIS